MGLFQDQTDSLSELRRLAALVMDPVRLHEIGASQWPLAMIAYGLTTCNDTDKVEYSLGIYPHFVRYTPAPERLRCLSQLSRFIVQRKGDGWRAFLCFALADPDASLRRHAAFLIATLAPPTAAERFTGIEELCNLLSMPLPETAEPLPSRTPLLDSTLSLSDLRFLPVLRTVISQENEQTLSTRLAELDATPNALSCEWLLDCLDAHPGLHADICGTLCRIAPKAEQIVDLILPVPTWQYAKPVPQPLHGWTRPEYFQRMLHRLAPHMDGDEIDRIRNAWS